MCAINALYTLNFDEEIEGFNGDALKGILRQFDRLGLIKILSSSENDDGYSFRLNVESHDFYQEGGFHGKFELFQKNADKLLLEVEKLESSAANKSGEFTKIKIKISEYIGVIANIATIGDSIS